MNSRQFIYLEKTCVTSNILQLTYNVPCSKSLSTHCLWGSDAPFMQIVFSMSKTLKKHDFTLEKIVKSTGKEPSAGGRRHHHAAQETARPTCPVQMLELQPANSG